MDFHWRIRGLPEYRGRGFRRGWKPPSAWYRGFWAGPLGRDRNLIRYIFELDKHPTALLTGLLKKKKKLTVLLKKKPLSGRKKKEQSFLIEFNKQVKVDQLSVKLR